MDEIRSRSSLARPVIVAAQYLRMSTDYQRVSLDFQAAQIATYATKNCFEVVETYSDKGVSGLTMSGRAGLRRLISDVVDGRALYKAILVYDVSRWGRFQDIDESAHYEFLCRSAGVAVHYCAESFHNDGSMYSDVIKMMKRAMAGEFSRDLSRKTFHAQCQNVRRGYHQGGSAGYGLRRVMIDQEGRTQKVLERGQHKALRGSMVVLAPGPSQEVSTVQRAFALYVGDRLSVTEIADRLNALNGPGSNDCTWSAAKVRALLMNERYIGNTVYNKTSCKLRSQRRSNTPDKWVRSEQAFDAIINPLVFRAAQDQLSKRYRVYSDEKMIAGLKELSSRMGYVTTTLINSSSGMPTSTTYISRFGSMSRAYQLADLPLCFERQKGEPKPRERPIQRPIPGVLSSFSCKKNVRFHPENDDILLFGDTVSAKVMIVSCRALGRGKPQWRLRLWSDCPVDAIIIIRLDSAGRTLAECHVMPSWEASPGRCLTLRQTNSSSIDEYLAQGSDAIESAVNSYAMNKQHAMLDKPACSS